MFPFFLLRMVRLELNPLKARLQLRALYFLHCLQANSDVYPSSLKKYLNMNWRRRESDLSRPPSASLSSRALPYPRTRYLRQ
jgi:hypothetical protein